MCLHRTNTVFFAHIVRITALFFSHRAYCNVVFTPTIIALFVLIARITALCVHIVLLQRSLFTSHYYSAFCSHRTYYSIVC